MLCVSAKSVCIVLAGLFALAAAPGRADVLYSQPPATTGSTLPSAYTDPDGSDGDQYVWDGFLLPAAASITEIQWRGGYPGVAASGNLTRFKVSIYASIPAGTQPDLGYLYTGPLVSYSATGNASETLVGVVNGTYLYDYHFVLPHAFAAVANTRYWVQIEAWQTGWANWGIAAGTGGNGTHFHRISYVGDAYYYIGVGDTAFTIIGTPTACTNPVVTQNPLPVTVCSSGGTATFSVAATGAGTLTYRWRQNGALVYDGPNGGGHGGGAFNSGATTATLTIVNPSSWADLGTYDCVVTNACGPTTSAGAPLTMNFGAPTTPATPANAVACLGGAATFSSISGGDGPLTYAWTFNGAPLSDGPTPAGSVVSGSSTTTLTISGITAADSGAYACTATNACAPATSGDAILAVCFADFDCSGAATVQDIFAYLAAWFAGSPRTDINSSGAVDVQDIFDFLAAWFAGC